MVRQHSIKKHRENQALFKLLEEIQQDGPFKELTTLETQRRLKNFSKQSSFEDPKDLMQYVDNFLNQSTYLRQSVDSCCLQPPSPLTLYKHTPNIVKYDKNLDPDNESLQILPP